MTVTGQLFVEGAPDPRVVELRVEDGRVDALAGGRAVASLSLDALTIEPGGFDGEHLFLRSPDGRTTMSSRDPALRAALERVADDRLRGLLDAASDHRRRHHRMSALGLWTYRLRYVALLGLGLVAAALAWASLR